MSSFGSRIGAFVALTASLLSPVVAWGARSVTIDEALALARQHNSDLKLARTALVVATAERVGARVSHPLNPLIELKPGLRISDRRTTSLDLEFGLQWEVEIGGQRRHRIGVAHHGILAARARVRYLEWAVSRQVLAAFHAVGLARERLRLNEEVRLLTLRLVDVAKRRLDAGEDTLLSLNLAQLELAHGEAQRIELQAKLLAARLRLTVLLGLPPRAPVLVRGGATLPGKLAVALVPLIDRALRVRQDLVALQRRIVANRRRIALADAQRIPNLIFSLKYGREEDANLIVAGIGLSLPFFQRNQGDRARVRALDQRLRASERRARLEIEREVVAAWLAQRAAQRRLAHYGNKIFTRFKAQLRLLEESFRAGKIGLPQVLLFQRQLLGSQRAIVEAKAALIRARIRLEQAVGGSLSLKTVRSK